MKLFYVPLLAILLLACSKSDDDNITPDDNIPPNDTLPPISDTAFSEGMLTMEISMPGNPLAEILGKLDPSKGNIEEQLAEEIGKLPIEEQVALSEFFEDNPMFALVALMTPLRSELYVRPDEILAKVHALNYYLENYQSTSEDKGVVYLESLSSDENHMMGTYTPSLSESIWQSVTITHEDYNIERLNTTAVVAGFECRVASYTLKNIPDDEADQNPFNLLVYTSEAMPKELNFQHPFYIPEDNGILRIDVSYDKEGKNKMIYQAVNVESKTLGDADFVTETSPNVYDLDSDDPAAGLAIMAIMFGGE